uniref:Uncharacterized protein n=1 Tax=Candidatus Kentrum sp. TC TaxID=2126339 RepID=A0A450ZEL9_9GAMM|nr:MAG: hypothetical protein BECKTC1821D_GA0114238_11586 [Candidatus Kentron sp. TC]
MIKQTIGELLEDNVVLDIEGIDRMYLNLYQPMLQTGGGVSTFFREEHRGAKVTSMASMSSMTKSFVRDIHGFAKQEGVDVAPFAQGQNKDEITQAYLGKCEAEEGILYIGKAQEKFRTYRVAKHFNTDTGQSFPWLTRT